SLGPRRSLPRGLCPQHDPKARSLEPLASLRIPKSGRLEAGAPSESQEAGTGFRATRTLLRPPGPAFTLRMGRASFKRQSFLDFQVRERKSKWTEARSEFHSGYLKILFQKRPSGPNLEFPSGKSGQASSFRSSRTRDDFHRERPEGRRERERERAERKLGIR